MTDLTPPGAAPESDLLSQFFDYNGLASQPYFLRRVLLDMYRGESLQVLRAGGLNNLPFGRFLFIPPNIAAVVLLSDGRRTTRPPGRHLLARRVGPNPVAVQFVSTQVHSYTFMQLSARTADHMDMAVDLRLAVQAADSQLVTNWRDPVNDIRGALLQVLGKVVGEMRHADCLRDLPDLLEVNAGIERQVARLLEQFGLRVLQLFLLGLHPDPRHAEQEREATLKLAHLEREHERMHKDLELRGQIVHKSRVVQQMEAQAEEDVFAVKQPAFRRHIAGSIAGQVRERNQEARLEAIRAVSDVAKALLEEFHRNPGRVYTPQDMEPLMKALEMLDKLSAPVAGPPIPMDVRSRYAVDKNAPTPPDLTA